MDYDNDGSLDLFVTSTDASISPSQNELFRNEGNGTFTKMTARIAGNIVPGGGGSEGGIWADYDNDGFVDLSCRYGFGGFIQRPGTVPQQHNQYYSRRSVRDKQLRGYLGDE